MDGSRDPALAGQPQQPSAAPAKTHRVADRPPQPLGSQIAPHPMDPIIERFDTWGITHAGLFTFAQSPKHLGLITNTAPTQVSDRDHVEAGPGDDTTPV